MYFLPAERLRLYRNFKSIEVSDFYAIIRFYEQNEDAIRSLDFEEYLDCTLCYTHALYEATNFGKHLVMCDHLLELVIMHNVDQWGGEDLYHQLLTQKAASFYYQEAFVKAERILKEIIRIYPDDKLAAIQLNRTLLHQKPTWLFKARAAMVMFALLAVVVIALEILAVPYFFPHLLTPMQLAHQLLVGLSLAALFVAEAGHSLRCWYLTRRFVHDSLVRKSQSK
ncbi:MAG: hypothetical protein J0M29_12290 [Chitinophagales bacterium]|nr:hypothetical protein [Chitinophagales bacterium]